MNRNNNHLMPQDREKIIVVVGYPRSGNTWLARLLGEVLDSPVGGFANALPLATEGSDRTGKYYIAQLHMKPVFDEDADIALLNAWAFNVSGWQAKEKVVTIYRDPRDIAVSAMHYWNRGKLMDILVPMCTGNAPLHVVGSWNNFVTGWLDLKIPNWYPFTSVYYEALHMKPIATIKSVLKKLNIQEEFSDSYISGCVMRQSFDIKKAQVAQDGDKRPYGKAIQTTHMRRGIVGDWKNHFAQEDAVYFQEQAGRLMQRLGYVTDEYWWMTCST